MNDQTQTELATIPTETELQLTTVGPDEYVPEALFGQDHWNLLGYIETVMVDCEGFQVGCDARMRQTRRSIRIMQQGCKWPKRTASSRCDPAYQDGMDAKYGTRMNNGVVLGWSDDWACVQDFAAAEYFTVDADDIEPKAILHLSTKGQRIAAQLRQHKAMGGTWRSFVPQDTNK